MTAMTRLELITTIDATGGRNDDLIRLIGSVEAFRRQCPAVAVHHRLLVQQCDDAQGYATLVAAPTWMSVQAVPRQIPLSVARNILLKPVLADEGVDADCLVAFPDDDAWYADDTLRHIANRFGEQPDLDLWFCRYGSTPSSPPAAEVRPSLQSAISFASSNTIVLRGSLLHRIGGFDETLGLGTPLKSGEDTDFAIRAFLAARAASFAPARLIGHRDFDPTIRAKYYTGALAAIAKHARRSPAAVLALGRKLAVGAALCGKRELTPRQWIAALSMLAKRR